MRTLTEREEVMYNINCLLANEQTKEETTDNIMNLMFLSSYEKLPLTVIAILGTYGLEFEVNNGRLSNISIKGGH